MPELEAIFQAELAERVSRLRGLVDQVEHGTGDPRRLRRELHSLKGAARAVGNSAVEALAHAAEGVVRASPIDLKALRAAVAELAPAEAKAEGPEALEPEPEPELEQEQEQQKISVAKVEESVGRREESVSAPQLAAVDKSAASVRVAVSKLDALLTESGELSVTHLRISQRLSEIRELQRRLERWQREWLKSRALRARMQRAHGNAGARDLHALLRMNEQADHELHALVAQTAELINTFSQNTTQLGAIAGAISQEVMAVRLLPAGTIFMPLERLVRDLARQTGKKARLTLSGIDTEVDRRILDELRDPLMHMVRNAVDHAIEPADERVALGKPARGTLHLSAEQRGDRVHITLHDDGRGLDVEAIRSTAVRRGLVSAERATQLEPENVIDLIFQPGFSTRERVSELSGRGVGMDVVREHVSRLGGDIFVHTEHGQGSTFTIAVPLTLATTRVLLVEDGGRTYAIPSSAIGRTGRVRAIDLQRTEGCRALPLDGRTIPVVELGDVLQRANDTNTQAAADEWRPFFVLSQGERAIALLTDRLIDEQELVVKALGAPLVRVKHVGGAAVLGTGAVVVILNPSDLMKSALGSLDAAPLGRARDVPAVAEPAPRRRVLVVDDSVMTRTLERSILESAGYEVVVASDGQHALDLLTAVEEAAFVDAIVSDVEMPRLSGIGLTAAVRQDERLRHLPVVLVTSLDAPEHVEKGAAAGADAYIVKGRFDQNELLQTLGRLL